MQQASRSILEAGIAANIGQNWRWAHLMLNINHRDANRRNFKNVGRLEVAESRQILYAGPNRWGRAAKPGRG
jgi:hypothetical protein